MRCKFGGRYHCDSSSWPKELAATPVAQHEERVTGGGGKRECMGSASGLKHNACMNGAQLGCQGHWSSVCCGFPQPIPMHSSSS
jgi:hypothetical protein